MQSVIVGSPFFTRFNRIYNRRKSKAALRQMQL